MSIRKQQINFKPDKIEFLMFEKENYLFQIGMIMLEMMNLQRISLIYTSLNNQIFYDRLENRIKKAQQYYSSSIILLIRNLLFMQNISIEAIVKMKEMVVQTKPKPLSLKSQQYTNVNQPCKQEIKQEKKNNKIFKQHHLDRSSSPLKRTAQSKMIKKAQRKQKDNKQNIQRKKQKKMVSLKNEQKQLKVKKNPNQFQIKPNRNKYITQDDSEIIKYNNPTNALKQIGNKNIIYASTQHQKFINTKSIPTQQNKQNLKESIQSNKRMIRIDRVPINLHKQAHVYLSSKPVLYLNKNIPINNKYYLGSFLDVKEQKKQGLQDFKKSNLKESINLNSYPKAFNYLRSNRYLQFQKVEQQQNQLNISRQI